MANIKKHVGRVRSTDKRCVVVFMSLPDDKEKALIIEVESLPPRYEQILLEVVDSQEAQNENDLANAMARRMVQETGRTILEEFHLRNLMRTEPIDNIIMMPRPNTPFPLRDILEQMGTISAATTAATAAENSASEDVKYNPIINNLNAAGEQQRMLMATNLLAEAEMLQIEANKKREQAYRQVPKLRPTVVSAVASPVLNETATLEDNPIKRGPGRPPKAKVTNG